MSLRDYYFVEHMEAGKERAHARRARGLSTGTAAKGWTRKNSDYAPDPEPGTWAHLAAVTRASWRGAAGEAIEAYRFAVYGDQWESL